MITLNLHINYDCPLSCRYCCQRQNPNLLEAYFSADEMIEIVQNFMNIKNVKKCNINISGGEPLLKFKDIQKLMETFPNNSYEISTSGYLLTEEKAKFFSYYDVSYILSIDGGERVTNYLRPLANGEQGYFKKLKENIPHILYYSPKTRAKLIVPKNLISEIFNTYLELERLGFQEIFITPNVYENEVDNFHPELETGHWNEKDWDNFRNEIFKILKEIELGILENKKRCIISNIIGVMTRMITPNIGDYYNKNKLICEVLDFKGGTSPKHGQIPKIHNEELSLCLTGANDNTLKNQKDLFKRIKEDYKKLTGICPRDKECPYQSTCIYTTCLSENLKSKHGNILIASPFQCKTQKIYHDSAMLFFDFLNNNINEATEYYWNEINYRKEVLLDNALLSSCNS